MDVCDTLQKVNSLKLGKGQSEENPNRLSRNLILSNYFLLKDFITSWLKFILSGIEDVEKKLERKEQV